MWDNFINFSFKISRKVYICPTFISKENGGKKKSLWAITVSLSLCLRAIIIQFVLSISNDLDVWHSRFGKFCGIVTVESFAASAMGLTVWAMVPTTEAAMAVGPSLMTVFIVFGGYFVNPENTPIIFHWIPRVSLIRWWAVFWFEYAKGVN